MIDFGKIKKEHGGMICRACLNNEYGLNLTPKDCDYYDGRRKCASCRYAKHVVKGLKLTGKMKTLFK